MLSVSEQEGTTVGKPERIIVNITTGENGWHEVGMVYQPVTPEWSAADEQAARELAIATLCNQAIQMRLQQGQSVPPAFLALAKAKTFMEFF